MKKLFTLFAFAITLIATAQAPQGFNYQATVRNTAGQLLLNQSVSFKFSILQNSDTGTVVYSENQTANTDDIGHIALVVGQGTATTGTFSSINWANGSYFLGIELNTGSGYVAMGTTQLLSVPYALYANTAGNSQASIPNLASVLAVNNGANNLQIKNLADPTDAKDAVTNSFLTAQIATLQTQITALQNAIVAPLPNVTIGTQIWSSANLDVTTYRDGTPIPQVTDPTQWANLTTGAWCYFNNDPANGTIYGKLYNWYAVAGIHDTDPSTPNKILAPQGWHVPSDAEWTTLTDFLGGGQVAGGKMKSTGTSLWLSPNTAATNESGFTGLPASYRNLFGIFNVIGDGCFWWSSSEFNTTDAWPRGLYYGDGVAYRDANNKRYGFSIRCLRD